MARDSDRGGLAGFLDRLLGRRPQERAPEGKPLFTAHQPPPATRAEAPQPDEEHPSDAASVATEAADAAGTPTDLFDDRPLRRFPRDAWEEPIPAPEPEPGPGPEPAAEPEPATTAAAEAEAEPDDEDSLHTAVHADAIERAAPRPRTAPDVRVHDGHLEDRARPVELTPSQALELVRGGRDSLKRRDRE